MFKTKSAHRLWCGCIAIIMAYCALGIANVEAATTYTIKGKSISHTSVSAGKVGGCWAYANAIYKLIFGKNFSNSFSDSDNSLKNLSDDQRKITAANTKKFIENAALGASIRIANAPSGDKHFSDDDASYTGHDCKLDSGKLKYGHSMILVAKSSTGFTFIQSSGGKSSEKTVTWQGFADGYASRYVYFKYIKWPGAQSISTIDDKFPHLDPLTPMSEGYTFNNDEKAIAYIRPYSDSEVVKTYKQGDIIEVVGSGVNKWNNTWYKTTSGSYVYSGDVDYSYTIEQSNLNDVYKCKSDQSTYLYPYDSRGKAYSLNKGNEVIVVAAVRNKTWIGTENLWYKLNDGRFVYSSDVEYVRKNVDISISIDKASPASGLPKTGGTGIPTGNLAKGKGFGLRGVISSSENISSVTGTVFSLTKNENALKPITITSNNKTVDIQKTKINDELKFGSLPDGAYQYTVVVKTASGVTQTVIDSRFTVGEGKMPSDDAQHIDTPSPSVPTSSAQLTASASSMQADGTFTVTLGIKNNPGFGAMVLSFLSDNNVTLEKAEAIGIAVGSLVSTGSRIDLINGSDIVGNGDFLKLTFKASQTNDTTITLKSEKAAKVDTTVIAIDSVSVKSIRSNRIPGDANDDGAADILDAMLILRYDCGWDVKINKSNSDVNADNSVDILDAMQVLRYDCGWNVVLK